MVKKTKLVFWLQIQSELHFSTKNWCQNFEMYHLTAKKSILAELKRTLLEQLVPQQNQNNKCRVYILSKSGYSCKPLLAVLRKVIIREVKITN